MATLQNLLPDWLKPDMVTKIAAQNGAPLYVYSEAALREQAEQALALPAPYGLIIRYAMKANPHPEILRIFKDQGLHIDASSGFEAEQAIEAGYKPDQILLTAQEIPENLLQLVQQGIQFTATSLHQLETYCKLHPNSEVSVRINPNVGSGLNNRLTTGGVNSSFGIWHEYIAEVKRIADSYGCKITRLHTHIGSGADPSAWEKAEAISIDIVRRFADVTSLNLGGGFKVAYMPDEKTANMQQIGIRLKGRLESFAKETGRKLELELEPGKFLVANSSVIISKIIDKTDTGENGRVFLRINTGMNDLLRPGIYGAQHPITTIKADGSLPEETEEVIVVGHNCESTDVLTPYPGDPERIQPRDLGRAEIGDFVVIGMTGAYGAGMRAVNYNGFPSAKEFFV